MVMRVEAVTRVVTAVVAVAGAAAALAVEVGQGALLVAMAGARADTTPALRTAGITMGAGRPRRSTTGRPGQQAR